MPKRKDVTESKSFRSALTIEQDIFVNELVKGKSQRQAFLVAWPHKAAWQWNSIDAAASAEFRKQPVRARYNSLILKLRNKEQRKTEWTRDQAIKTLKDVIDRNKDEQERIQAAINDEIEVLLEKIHKNPSKAEKYTKELLTKRKARITSNTYNTGIINAVSELNKMEGFNEENINLNGSIVFSDENKLEE